MDNDTMNNIKNMVDNGDISGAISQISPEMIQNFSKILNQNNNNSNSNNSNNSNNLNSSNSTNANNSNENFNNSFNMNNLDMNTVMKITSAFNKINNQNDPRANLLYSLKPYLRDGRKEKLDQYVNLLNVSRIAEILKDDQKENK